MSEGLTGRSVPWETSPEEERAMQAEASRAAPARRAEVELTPRGTRVVGLEGDQLIVLALAEVHNLSEEPAPLPHASVRLQLSPADVSCAEATLRPASSAPAQAAAPAGAEATEASPRHLERRLEHRLEPGQRRLLHARVRCPAPNEPPSAEQPLLVRGTIDAPELAQTYEAGSDIVASWPPSEPPRVAAR